MFRGAAVPDPTTDAAMAIVSGAATVTVAALGVHPQVLLYAGVGAGFGMLATRAESRGRAIAYFALTTLAGALIAHILARHFFDSDHLWRNGMALLMGITFPALRERAMTAAPD